MSIEKVGLAERSKAEWRLREVVKVDLDAVVKACREAPEDVRVILAHQEQRRKVEMCSPIDRANEATVDEMCAPSPAYSCFEAERRVRERLNVLTLGLVKDVCCAEPDAVRAFLPESGAVNEDGQRLCDINSRLISEIGQAKIDIRRTNSGSQIFQIAMLLRSLLFIKTGDR